MGWVKRNPPAIFAIEHERFRCVSTRQRRGAIMADVDEWVGPFQIRKLLESCFKTDPEHWPPNEPSVYLVSQYSWKSAPTIECGLLYLGSITGNSQRFRTRIGDLVADAFGFFNEGNRIGHSIGGRKIYNWCRERRRTPFDLHIAWLKQPACNRCCEFRLFRRWKDKLGDQLLNEQTPSRCRDHSTFATT
jgi:hypothetical protein